MGFFSWLFGKRSHPASAIKEKPLSQRDVDVIIESTSRSVDIVNQSLELAASSKNGATRLSRIWVAKQHVEALRIKSSRFRFLKLSSIEAAPSEFVRLEQLIANVSPQEAIADHSASRQWRDVYGLPSRDTVDGYRFRASLHYGTPLSGLELDGQFRVECPGGCLGTADGNWSPIFKSGFEPERGEPNPAGRASSIDYEDRARSHAVWLRWLIKVRQVLESSRTADEKVEDIGALRDALVPTSFRDSVPPTLGRLLVSQPLYAIKGITPAIGDALWERGYRTPLDLVRASDEALLKIPRFGAARLKKLREALSDSNVVN